MAVATVATIVVRRVHRVRMRRPSPPQQELRLKHAYSTQGQAP
jgi:hypothetical protein